MNKILIYRGGSHNKRFIVTNHNFFEIGCDVIVKQDEESIIFTKPTIDYNGKTHKCVKNQKWKGYVNISILSDAETGDYTEFEATEDSFTIYLK